jgi:hypothetical protein
MMTRVTFSDVLEARLPVVSHFRGPGGGGEGVQEGFMASVV